MARRLRSCRTPCSSDRPGCLTALDHGAEGNSYRRSVRHRKAEPTVVSHEDGEWRGSRCAREVECTGRHSGEWAGSGQKQTWTNPLARRWTYGFDPKGRASLTFDPTRVCVTTSFDACDRAIVSVDVLGRCGTNVYDAANQLQATVAPDGTRLTFLYDSLGHPTEVIENTGLRTTTLYDAVGRPPEPAQSDCIGPSRRR
jgi:YD repeat-containing protein